MTKEEKNKKKKKRRIAIMFDNPLAIEKIGKDGSADSHVTFQAALEQAIHTSDQQMLQRCLGVSTQHSFSSPSPSPSLPFFFLDFIKIGNYEMIKSTLQKLAPSFIIPLVKLLITMLQSAAHPQSLYSYPFRLPIPLPSPLLWLSRLSPSLSSLTSIDCTTQVPTHHH